MTRHLDMISVQQELWVLVQALIALILGGMIGLEREATGNWAGFRTHMLVCLASMLLIRMGHFLVEEGKLRATTETISVDPVRMMEVIMAGIAFIGAGMVFRDPDRSIMRGLTTAASMIVVVPIGVAVAIDRYVLAVGGTGLLLLVLNVMNRLKLALDIDGPGDIKAEQTEKEEKSDRRGRERKTA